LTYEVVTISFDPAKLDLGEQEIGDLGPARTLTIKNDGARDLAVASIRTSGNQRSDFLIADDGCTDQPVRPGNACAIAMRFAPSSVGNRDATLTVRSDAPSSPDSVPLAGSGLSPRGDALMCHGVPATILAAPVRTTRGSKRSDVILGSRRAERIFGGRGDDLTCAAPGDDRIVDTKGRNKIDCGSGHDTVTTNRRSKVAKNCEDLSRR
jgi:hypothetical protein